MEAMKAGCGVVSSHALSARLSSPSLRVQVHAKGVRNWRALLAPVLVAKRYALLGAALEHSSCGRERKYILKASVKLYALGDNMQPAFSSNSEGDSKECPSGGDLHQTSDPASQQRGGIWQWWREGMAKKVAQREELTNQLTQYGLAGVLSYGLLNTVYYLVAFLFVWFYVAPSPGGLGFAPAAERFVKVFAMVWAGSQVTKLPRAGGALALAPLVDKGLTLFTVHFNFKSRRQAFGSIVAACFLLAALVFLVISTLWA